jgi:hypothetical protein
METQKLGLKAYTNICCLAFVSFYLYGGGETMAFVVFGGYEIVLYRYG